MTTLNLIKTPTLPHRPQQTLRVTAFGDSLIYGYGDGINGGWVEQLRRRWMATEPSHVLYNLGVRGDTTAQVSQRLEAEFASRGELRHRQPDLILLSVGINDSPRLGKRTSKAMTDLERFKLEIAHLLDKAQQLCPVWFVGMVPVDESKMPFLDCLYFNHEDQFCYKEVTKLACQSRHIPYLDIFDLWQGRGANWLQSHLSADGLHPNSEGYRALFADVCAWEPMIELEQMHYHKLVTCYSQTK
ncbi:MAG: GDSL-type esterase/lipase family protein [Pseudanabaena sp. ELA607]